MKLFFKKLVYTVVASLCLVACSEDSVDDPTPVVTGGTGTTLTAVAPSDDSGSKVTFTDNDTSGISLDWEVDNDSFSVYDEYGDYVCDFKCTEVTANLGTFSSTSTTLESGDYTAIFPASTNTELSYAEAVAADLTSSQNGDAISSLNAACMMTASFTYSKDDGDVSMHFSHEKAVMTLVYQSDIEVTKVVFENGSDSYTVNYTTAVSTSSDDDYITSYIMIEPCAAYTRDLTFTFYNGDNIIAYREVESSKEYKKGSRYTSKIYSLTADIVYNDDGYGVYEIYSGKGLQAFEELVNGGSNPGANYIDYGTGNFAFASEKLTTIDGKLMNDIDLGDVCSSTLGNWEPIGMLDGNRYAGTFDGNGHVVKSLYINYDEVKSKQGLFGYLAANGVVKNLGVTGSIYCKIYGVTTDISGSGWEMGGIVSYNYGTVSNCYNSATISGDYNVGGVVGHNAAGALIENCYNRGDISGCRNIGGICGQNEGDVEYCYSTGEMTGNFTGQSDVSSDYTARVGGVVGFLYTSTTGVIPTTIGSFCLNNTTYSVGTGSSTSVKDNLMETITLSTCSGLNNNNAYQDDSDSKPINDGYPVLNWQVE